MAAAELLTGSPAGFHLAPPCFPPTTHVSNCLPPCLPPTHPPAHQPTHPTAAPLPRLQYERALETFEEAQALGIPMDCRAFNIALKACHTPGKTLRPEQMLQAFAIYDQLKRDGLQPDAFTFSTLFSLCAEARQGHCALQASGCRRAAAAVAAAIGSARTAVVLCTALQLCIT